MTTHLYRVLSDIGFTCFERNRKTLSISNCQAERIIKQTIESVFNNDLLYCQNDSIENYIDGIFENAFSFYSLQNEADNPYPLNLGLRLIKRTIRMIRLSLSDYLKQPILLVTRLAGTMAAILRTG